jgi:glycerol-3-phosphate dehydrogenase (NAD(P)+)
MKTTVIGSGGWGTAVSILLYDNGHDVTLWSAFEHEAENLRTVRENPLLKGIKIPEQIRITADLTKTGRNRTGCRRNTLFARMAETAAK